MNKTILITGASSGIGKAAVIKFAAEGWNVIATMRHPEQEKALRQIKNVRIEKLDVQQPDTISQAIENGIAAFGQIDAVVNNAGYGQNGLFEAISPEQVMKQFEVNVFGVMHVTRAILPHFRERKQGMILNISSGAGRFTLPLLSLYASSKFALEGFSEALSHELSTQNIFVKIIEPGGTETNFSKVAQEEYAHHPDLTDYQAFTEAASKMFAGMVAAKLVTAADVADVIYNAATDGTDTLRYVVGNDDFNKRIAARQHLSDQEYITFIRQGFKRFLPQN